MDCFLSSRSCTLSHPHPFPDSLHPRISHHRSPNSTQSIKWTGPNSTAASSPSTTPSPGSSRAVNRAGPPISFFEPGEETCKFRWVEIRPASQQLSEEQRMAISNLPKKMVKRCKAFLRQIICYSPEKGRLLDLVGAWVAIMKPIRADWLVVLKHLSDMDHPLFLQVFEYALNEESFEASVRDYTKIIHLYAKHNRIQDAENAVVAMNQRGMICDQVTLTTMIHMYSKAGNFAKAEEIFEEMKLLGHPLDKRSYGSMIMAYIRAGMPDKGEALVSEMDASEIYAGREVYKALLRVYSMKGDCEGAQRVFNAIQLSGTFPDDKQCALLINAYVVARQTQKARIAFENMRRVGIVPNDKCVAVLLAGYEKENNLNAALDLLIDLEKDGIMVGKEASELLAAWFQRIGVAEEVALVLREFAAK